MDSLSSTRGPPAPALLIRAPLSSPEEEEEEVEEADTSAALRSPTPSPASSSEEEEFFLSGEEEPESGFETASERPFVPEPDEEVAPDDELGGAPFSPAFLLKKLRAFIPKARLSMEEEDVAEEVFDDGLAADDDGEEAGVVRVAPQLGAERVGGVDLGGGGGGVLGEEDGGDDDVGVAEEVSAGGDGGALEGGDDDGVTGYREKAAVSTVQEGIEGEVRGDGMPHEKPASGGAAAAELPESVRSGDGSAAVVEEVGEDAHDGGLGDGDEEGTNLDARAVGEPEVVRTKSSYGVITGTEEHAVFDGEFEMGNGSGSAMEEGKNSATQVVLELEPGDGKSGGDAEESGGDRSGAVSDNNLETLETVVVESEELQHSETRENSGYTGEKAADSSEIKGGVGEVAGNGVLEVVETSVDPGDAESSLQKPDPLSSFEVADAGDEAVQVLGTETGDGRDHVNQAAIELKSHEINQEVTAEESGADPSLVDNLETGSTPDFETQKLQLSERKDTISQTMEEEEETADSSERKEKVEEVETDDALKPVDVSMESGDADHLLEKTYHVERTADDDDVYVSPESKKKINDSSEDTDNEDLHANLNGGEKKSGVASSKIAEQIVKELGEGSQCTNSRCGSSRDYSHEMDGQIVSDSDEEMETDEEGYGKELFDSATLAAILKAAAGSSSDGSITITAPDATRIFSVERPAGLGSAAASLKPAPPHTLRPNIFSPSELAVVGEPESSMDEEAKKLQEKIEQLRVKFLRLVHRLGHSPEDRVAAQVLYRLGLAEGIKRGMQIGQSFSFEKAKKKALQLEENENETLDFACNILVIGKTGVGKSATINSIFGEEKVNTDAFEPVASSVREIIGTVDGIRICVIDTPGLRSSVMDQPANMRTLASIKKYTKKCPPDIVLYVDRLDTQTWDFNDLPLLRSITSALGSSIWFNATIALTHAASAPPDGPNGSPLSYEVFVDQRSRVVQHAIRQASGDMRFMNPVALVENHPSCRRNREGQMVLPNGLSWRTQMLLLCYSSKILSDANSLLKLQDTAPGKLFGFRVRSPPLPFLLSSLLQSRVHPKLSTDQGVDNGDSDVDLGELSDSDQEEREDEYDQLPPFKPLRKAQIAKLTREQRKAYFDEYDYRVKLLQKKQWKEELKRQKEMKKRGKTDNGESEYGDLVDDYDQDSAPATVPVPLPDMVLPPSFDCDNPAHRYRFLEPTSQLIVRPVLDTHGWDHDCGYDGVSLEENLAIASKFPAGISIQVTKDKKDFSIHLDSSVSAKHGENGSTLAGFDIQSVGKQLAYILRSETIFRTLKNNKTAAGILVTFLGENIATGLKVEDQLTVGKRLGLVASTGAVRAQGDVAYGANLEVRLREKDFPIGQDVSSLGLSLMKWRSDLALGANLQSQISVGRNTKMSVRLGLNNKLSGQITVRTSTSEQLPIALLGILPIAASIYRSIWSDEAH
ncbi:hypothetical protein Taro_047572 [Colocasia esculenta]|uniref:AIG1-type G domain-containing protein n=1 Tax=Colocasia esculenta TaxID=4460 RepID=A0A843X6S7_COLES|nr:hypothetical protein [Colocasia esculenta]